MATATTTSPQLNASGTRAANPALPPIAAETPSRMPPMRRISSSARERLSVYSTASQTSHRSRPVSHVFPLFHSSLTYALVRDFAYASTHPLHYGPLPVPSRASTPASETRRLSDPQIGLWESSRHSWSSNSATSDSHGQQLPAVSFAADGPPYSEDEDLHSPIITSRYRKHKSMFAFGDTGSGFGNSGYQGDVPNNSIHRGSLVAVNEDGSKTYYVPGDQEANDGPGGEYITYPKGQGQQSQMGYGNYDDGSGVGGHEGGYGASSVDHGGDYFTYEEEYSDRYSRDYHFSIGSPDEEMHGKAVALFDFTREHENELPLKEGQVILVSYRHGQGWLVAEDPKTGESGLVPEEFVRLVRDIEGGLSSLNGELSSIANDPQYQPDTTSTTATSIQTSEDTSDAAATEQGESEQPERKNTRGEESDEQTERK